jgi:hypothetical protein
LLDAFNQVTTGVSPLNYNKNTIVPPSLRPRSLRQTTLRHFIKTRLSSSYDIMAVWIRSVKQAIQVLHHYTASLRAEAQRIFPQLIEAEAHTSDSTYTSGFDASDVILSLSPTEITVATTNSPSTNDSSISRSVTLLGSGDDSNTPYDDDALSFTSVLSTDTGSSDVEFTSVASEDLDRHSATQEEDIPLTQISTSDSHQRPLSSNTASSFEDVKFPSVAFNEQSTCSDQSSLGLSDSSNLSSFSWDGMGD